MGRLLDRKPTSTVVANELALLPGESRGVGKELAQKIRADDYSFSPDTEEAIRELRIALGIKDSFSILLEKFYVYLDDRDYDTGKLQPYQVEGLLKRMLAVKRRQ